MKLLEYILFGAIFLYTTLWTQINLFLSSFGQEKSPITIVSNDNIKQLVKKKTGINIGLIKIVESKRPFGAMIGIPTKPQLLLSRNLYDTFSPDEIEYVVLHEAGHYQLWHSAIELLVGFALLVVGIIVLGKISSTSSSILVAVILGLIFGIMMIRLGRLEEYQADKYALKHMTNPQGMIQATNKFKNFYGTNYTENRNGIVQFLFYRSNPYENRIVMAEEEIENRK